jgi:hypothetical protein
MTGWQRDLPVPSKLTGLPQGDPVGLHTPAKFAIHKKIIVFFWPETELLEGENPKICFLLRKGFSRKRFISAIILCFSFSGLKKTLSQFSPPPCRFRFKINLKIRMRIRINKTTNSIKSNQIIFASLGLMARNLSLAPSCDFLLHFFPFRRKQLTLGVIWLVNASWERNASLKIIPGAGSACELAP